MATVIRQEISIITTLIASSTASNSNEIVQLDTTQYVNPTYYFEVVHFGAASNTGTWKLRRSGTTTDDATTVAYTTGAYKRERVAFTPPAAQTEYVLRNNADGVRVQSAKAARIIVIDSPTTLTSTETQIEIGMNKTGLTSTTAVKVVPDFTLTKYWKYTAANWDGTKTFYAEVTYLMASSKSSGTFVLQEDDGAFGTWTDKVTIVNAGVASVATRTRSASFTPTDGRNYRIAYLVASSKSAASIFNAKIIVDQIGASVVNTYYVDGHTSIANPAPAWNNQANAFDGSTATFADTTSTTNTNFIGTGTNAPATGSQILSARARAYGSGPASASPSIFVRDSANNTLATLSLPVSPDGYGSYVALTTPSGGWTWSNVNTFNGLIFAGVTAGTKKLAKIEIEVTSNDGVTPITLLEPQYLLSNPNNAGAGLQNFQTLWDSTEWSGVTNVYEHAMDSNNASLSVKLTDITGSVDITNSTLTGANQQISAALTMPTTGHEIDTSIVTLVGSLAASRILVATTVNAVSTGPVGRDITPLNNNSGAYANQGVSRSGNF